MRELESVMCWRGVVFYRREGIDVIIVFSLYVGSIIRYTFSLIRICRGYIYL